MPDLDHQTKKNNVSFYIYIYFWFRLNIPAGLLTTICCIVESSASEASMDERGNKAEQPSDRPTSGEDANQGGDPFWILDLNPDLAS